MIDSILNRTIASTPWPIEHVRYTALVADYEGHLTARTPRGKGTRINNREKI